MDNGSHPAHPSIFRTSLPVAFGYLPLGMAFGALLSAQGYPWWWATIMSVVIYAGSAQFLAVSLLSSGAGTAEVFLATLLLNLRHVFYGLTLFDRYKALGRWTPYAIFGLTDETFSLLAGTEPLPADGPFVVRLTALNQAWWVLGSSAGALVIRGLPFSTRGLDFALTALFAVLLVEQLRKGFFIYPLLAASAAALIAILFLPANFFLIASIGMACLGLAFMPSDAGETR
jgi:4-azaleucine resistance transporter AzlC